MKDATPLFRKLLNDLYPICRSITGNGVRESLETIRGIIPLSIVDVPTGTRVFDWSIPREWNIKDAWIKNSKGEKIIDFHKSNLHVLNYSTPIDKTVRINELKDHIFTDSLHPEWIPYRTSYYKENWGFCMAHDQFMGLVEDEYHVYIDSSLTEGSLTYGELYLPSETTDEILFSCHICHPSLCNDNLSGIVIATHLAKSLLSQKNRLSYRFVFVPGTIGSIAWLSKNEHLVKNIKYGLVLSLLGDVGSFTYKKTRDETDRRL